MKVLTSVFLLLFWFSISAQTPLGDSTQMGILNNVWIPRIAAYRTYFLEKPGANALALSKLFKKWESIALPEENIEDIVFNILRLSAMKQYDFPRMKKKILKYMPGSNIAKTISEEELALIYENAGVYPKITS